MTTLPPEDESRVAGPPDEPEGTPEHYYDPQGRVEALNGRTVLPTVKRFNRKTVVVLAALGALVTIAALGTALSRKPLVKKATESQAQSAAAVPTLTDAVNTLPGDYRSVARTRADGSDGIPKLGAPLPGDIGAFAPQAGGGRQGAARQLTPYEQALAEERLEELKRAAKAREGGFGFSGGAGVVAVAAASEGGAQSVAGSVERGLTSYAQAGLQQSLASRDTDNRQDDKTSFAERGHKGSWLLREGVQTPLSPFTIFAGAVLPGVMITGINSDLPGQIEGQVSQNVYDTVTGKHLLIPQGTKVLGTYDSRITYGQSRVLVVWTRIIRPDGSNIDLEGMPGVDMSGYAGETGKVDRHLLRLLSAVLLGSVIQAGTAAGTSYTNPSFADLARQGAGQGVNEATQQIVRKELNIQPTITIAPGTRFNVFTTKDIILPPYAG
jgi:type IV secretion system protein VirB10